MKYNQNEVNIQLISNSTLTCQLLIIFYFFLKYFAKEHVMSPSDLSILSLVALIYLKMTVIHVLRRYNPIFHGPITPQSLRRVYSNCDIYMFSSSYW
jgi:hypothetical protein